MDLELELVKLGFERIVSGDIFVDVYTKKDIKNKYFIFGGDQL